MAIRHHARLVEVHPSFLFHKPSIVTQGTRAITHSRNFKQRIGAIWSFFQPLSRSEFVIDRTNLIEIRLVSRRHSQVETISRGLFYETPSRGRRVSRDGLVLCARQ